ncbi:dihydroorotase [Aciduricibacillus chroicocephali]|uniref:Dihydroorotase n=1 Tax=Aciduricibacillus chroicocephali TaxID=3054939 RepID=A0ABY9KY49_9BACI|nr:dihydroorotase [Bacillaceae bacterium 44XB]
MKTLLYNAKRLNEDGAIVETSLLIEDGKVKEIAAGIDSAADQKIDCEGHLLLPGLVDVHIHLREPGGEHKETIKTGTEAAARGGFTTICSMPNTKPVPDSVENLQDVNRRIEETAAIRVLPYASITRELQGGGELTDIPALAKNGAFAFTDDGVGIQTAHDMLTAMKLAAKENKAVVAHCEDNSIVYGGVVHDGEVAERLDLPGLPGLSESVQIARDVLLAEEANCHYHVCHISTKESVRAVRDAKAAGIKVTAEVTPHHLLLTEFDVVDRNDTNFKMNPPLRSKEDHQAILDGLFDGTIDFIATDHAPHAEEEKAKGFIESPFGIVGLETAFPLMYTYFVQEGKCTLKQLVEWMATKPADVFDLPYGKMEEGAVADLVLMDLDNEYTIDKNDFKSKGRNTPFHGWKVKGRPVLTIFEGEIVYDLKKEGK